MAEQQQGVVPPGYQPLKEGQATVLLRGKDAFYNEAQCTNRDLSTAVLRTFLPMLAQEKEQGLLKKNRNQQQPRGKRQQKGGQQQDQQQQPQQPQQQEPQQQQQQQPQQQQGGGQEHQQEGVQGQQHQQQQQPSQQQQQQQQQPQQHQASDAQGAPSTSTHDAQQQQHQQPQLQQKNSDKGAVILEGLAATGLRAIRYALEIPGVKRVDANDLDPAVGEAIRRNVAFNGGEAPERVRVLTNDARIIMMQSPFAYDVVDLDPYGTPAQLLDSAVQSVGDGGLLLVTATDMANLCGNNSVSCWSNYGSYPVHRAYCHEMALRILLGCIETHASRYRRHIKPLLSMSIDFYVRVFVRVYTSAAESKEASCRMSYIWQSSGCDSYWLQPVGQKRVNGQSVKYAPSYGPALPSDKCPETGSSYIMGGPIWSDPIHDPDFVQTLMGDLQRDSSRYATYGKIRGLLSSAADELPDVPLYYDLHDVCRTVKSQPPKMEIFRSAIINAGYRVSGSHANPLAVKTDAPPEVIWDIIRCWVKEHPVNVKDPSTYMAKLLSKEPKLQASFARAPGAMKRDNEPRFPPNPENWGPKTRHLSRSKQQQQMHKAVPDQGKQQQQQQQEQQQQPQQQGQGQSEDKDGPTDKKQKLG